MKNEARPGTSVPPTTTSFTKPPSDEATAELHRATDLLSQHLQARGVSVHTNDAPEQIALLMETVEAFEAAVEARGGDLMVDEAPEGKTAQPDNPQFVLPTREANESVEAFIARIGAATSTVRS